jgi:hypothetical protein
MEDDREPKEVPTRAEPAPASAPTPAKSASEGSPGMAPKPKRKSVDDPWGEEWFPADRRKSRR